MRPLSRTVADTNGWDMPERGGSTRRELKNGSLFRFLLHKRVLHWDAVPVPDARVEDLSEATAINGGGS